MLCELCRRMLRDHEGRDGKATKLYLQFKHDTLKNIGKASERSDCYVCRTLAEYLVIRGYDVDSTTAGEKHLVAMLQLVRPRRDLFRLDFKLDDNLITTFVLQENGQAVTSLPELAATSASTDDPDVIACAKDWISRCIDGHPKCCPITKDNRGPGHDPTMDQDQYPARLLDLSSLLENFTATGTVRLVSRKDGNTPQPQFSGRYMTLSHRWGRTPILKLTRARLNEFFGGINLAEMPKTFQDAIKVTCKLETRWLWIDSLCIVQDDENLKDWLEEAPTMEKVYANSYCNISATAAMDGSEGLFHKRDMTSKWHEIVTLNTNRIRRDPVNKISCTIMDPFFWQRYVDDAPVNRRSWVYQERILAPRVLHWCKDQIAFECRQSRWAELRPEDLPQFLLKSGTVVEDRRLKSGDVEEGKQLMTIREHSSNRPAPSRMVDEAELISPIRDEFYLYELWKHWVEIYSKMELTKASDRLIALSGVARMLTTRLEEVGARDQYIAGMWQKYLASQLLWYVNEGQGHDRQPLESLRPVEYRAPTFSWASIETPRGVTFAETTDEGMLVDILITRLIYRTAKDRYGQLTDGYIVLRGVLRKVELIDEFNPIASSSTRSGTFIGSHDWNSSLPLCLWLLFATLNLHILLWQSWWLFLCGSPLLLVHLATTTACYYFRHQQRQLSDEFHEDVSFDPKANNRYKWRLMIDGEPKGKLYYEEVWLDSPLSEPSIFGPDAQVYCIPIRKNDKYLYCLLVQAKDGDYGMRYQRVGMTRVSELTPIMLHDLTTPPGNNEYELGEYYYSSTWKQGDEKSTICIV